MAIMDAFLEFSDAQALTSAAGAAVSMISTNIVDLGASGTDTWGSGDTIYPGWWDPKELVLTVQTTGAVSGAASATNCNMVISVVTSATAAACTQSADELLSTGNITSDTFKTECVLWRANLPRSTERFMGVKYYFSDDPIDIDVDAWIALESEFGHHHQ